ncbi:hypothetical protein VNO78_17204 [Psophocarpus tetragonolobus]|uniref:Uncharacterized protein n=1 Tax=Psophocarpus tetragonolobus TaxID=3891 RepID=A0AAN9XL66_PSOTE
MESGKEAKVQRVTKKSSDELLRKFADEDEGAKTKRRKKRRERYSCESETEVPSAALVHRKLTRRSLFLRRLTNNSSFFPTTIAIHKTWCRTVEGASRVFLEKHYHRHKRLINDIV